MRLYSTFLQKMNRWGTAATLSEALCQFWSSHTGAINSVGLRKPWDFVACVCGVAIEWFLHILVQRCVNKLKRKVITFHTFLHRRVAESARVPYHPWSQPWSGYALAHGCKQEWGRHTWTHLVSPRDMNTNPSPPAPLHTHNKHWPKSTCGCNRCDCK